MIHVVWHERERKRKIENPEKSTRMSINCHSPEAWSELQIQKERYILVAVDPSIAVLLMIRALRQVHDDELRQWLQDGPQEENTSGAPGPPRAEIPKWLQD